MLTPLGFRTGFYKVRLVTNQESLTLLSGLFMSISDEHVSMRESGITEGYVREQATLVRVRVGLG